MEASGEKNCKAVPEGRISACIPTVQWDSPVKETGKSEWRKGSTRGTPSSESGSARSPPRHNSHMRTRR